MPGVLRMSWLVEGRVRLLVASGEITLPMLKRYDAEVRPLYENGTYGRYFIADVSQMVAFPSIRECLQIPALWHTHLDELILVGAQRFPLRFLFSALMGLARISYQDAATMAEAKAYLLSVDSTLPPLDEWKDVQRV